MKKTFLILVLILSACAAQKPQYYISSVVIERVVSNKEYYDDPVMNYTVTYRVVGSNDRYIESTFNKPGEVGDTISIRRVKL